MGNHCIYTVCRECGEEYCLRCHMGSCPKCGTPWNEKPVSVDEFLGIKKNGGGTEMTIDEIYQAASILSKTDRIKLINKILVGIKDSGTSAYCAEDVPMPVFEGLTVFSEIYRQRKGMSYTTSRKYTGADYKSMKELLLKINDRLSENGTKTVTDALRIGTLKMFLEGVCEMKNRWYFTDRFTPYCLNNDFEKIFSNLVNNSEHARRKTAFDNL